MPFIVFDRNEQIFGAGESLSAAVSDAAQWSGEAIVAHHGLAAGNHPWRWLACTAALADRVAAVGGDVVWNRCGELADVVSR